MLSEQQLMKDVKIKLQELKDEDLKLMLSTKKQITFLNEEVIALKRERAKYEDMISKQKKQNDKVLDSFIKYQAWMDDKVLSMNTGFLQLQGETLGMTAHVKKDYEMASAKFKELEKEVQNKMLANDKKYQILELYLSERQYNKLKMIQLQDKFSQYAPLQKIDYLRLCQVKELEMNKTEINTILHTYLPPAIKEMLPKIEKKVKEIDVITEQVKDLQGYMFESEQEMNSFKNATQSLQTNIKKDMKQISGTFLSNIETLKTDVKLALAMDQKQTQQRIKFEKDLSMKIQAFVKEENELIFERIQEQTLRMLDQIKKQDESKIQEHHQLMQRRCEQVRVTSGNIEKLLGSYNSRIVKIRSDTELFKNEMMKEMKTLASIKQQSQQKFQDFGKIIAGMVEIIQTNLSMQMNLDEQSLRNDNFAFATHNDGIIYQVVPMYSKEGDRNNPNQITYRRNKLEIPHLRRSLLTSVVNLIDRIYESYPYLQWKNYRPSNFFKEEILSNYFVQVEKYGEGNYIHNSSANINNNNSSNNNNSNNNNKRYNINNYTHNHNETDILNKSSSVYKNLDHSSSMPKNLDHSSTVFKRNKISDKAYSPSRKQEFISATIDSSQLAPKYNDNFQGGFQRLGQTIDEGIQFNRSKDNSFNLGERDKQAIRRAMRTLHQVHPRDSQNNRTVMTSSNHACSFIKQDQRTLDLVPQTAGGQRKKFINKSKRQLGQSQSRYKNNDTETFMTSRSTRRAISISNYKIE